MGPQHDAPSAAFDESLKLRVALPAVHAELPRIRQRAEDGHVVLRQLLERRRRACLEGVDPGDRDADESRRVELVRGIPFQVEHPQCFASSCLGPSDLDDGVEVVGHARQAE